MTSAKGPFTNNVISIIIRRTVVSLKPAKVTCYLEDEKKNLIKYYEVGEGRVIADGG